MEIILGKTSGFCYGVKRAVEGALEESKKSKKVFCLGELVHNKQVTKELENNGIEIIEDIKEINDKKIEEPFEVVIRAHGVKKDIYTYAEKEKIKLLDFTCPNVIQVHKIAQEHSTNDYYVFLTGKKEHPENIGTISYCNNYSVIEKVEDVEKAIREFEKSKLKKLLLISQTTYNVEKFYLIREKISYCLKDKEVIFDIENTICPTTEARQKEASEISKKVDCMLIIGGKNSSNTRKLFDVSTKNCNNTYLIEHSIKEVEKIEEIIKFADNIGIMAGASTPYSSIKNVIKEINM